MGESSCMSINIDSMAQSQFTVLKRKVYFSAESGKRSYKQKYIIYSEIWVLIAICLNYFKKTTTENMRKVLLIFLNISKRRHFCGNSFPSRLQKISKPTRFHLQPLTTRLLPVVSRPDSRSLVPHRRGLASIFLNCFHNFQGLWK